MAKVSVIIPAYNSEQFIAETLDSLINQTLKDIEVIIVNDGSTDGTQSIIDAYCKKHSIFKSFIKENGGVSKARNYGLERATGKYVVFLDADDTYTETSLEAFYETAEKTGADLVLGRLMNFGKDIVSKYNAFADRLASMEEVPTFTKILLWSFLVGNKCYNRERLMKTGVRFPAYKYSEEGAFFMSYVYTGAKIAGTMDACMCYRRHTKQEGLSVSQTVTADLAKSFSGSLQVIYDKAVEAVKTAPDDVDREDYIQEVIYKTAYILLSQFYRLLWQGDDECVKYCAEEFNRLKALMTESRFKVIQGTDPDLHLENIYSGKKQIAENPNISVIIKPTKKDLSTLFDGIYGQLSPMFEVIVSESTFSCGAIPEKYLKMENLKVLPDEGFMKNAKRKAKSKWVIHFKRNKTLDKRIFRLIYKVKNKLPAKVVDVFFPHIMHLLNLLLVKRIIK